MRRREFITLLGGTVAWPLVARAQQPQRMRRIGDPKHLVGVLMPGANDGDGQALIAAFRKAFESLGWRDGDNVRVEIRWGAGEMRDLQVHADELLSRSPNVILALSGRVVALLQGRTRDIPIVFVGPTDPVGQGYVESMARPGGNITGFTYLDASLTGKWLEMLKEAAPQVARVGLMTSPENPAYENRRRVLIASASMLGVKVVPIQARTAAEIESAVGALAAEPNGSLVLPPDATLSIYRDMIAALSVRLRLPAISAYREFAASGGLMSYGIDQSDIFRRAASYVDRILNGEKAADLPVQQPTKFELVINLKTAKALGLEIPPTLLARADEVIE